MVKTDRSASLVYPLVRHVFRPAAHCLEADTQDQLYYHEGHEEHEGNQSTNRFIPSFSLVTLKFINSPILIPANFIEVSSGTS